MTMGQRILQARLDAGLSQRELAGEEITRNMLSSLEHDTANPSVPTLRYLARRLGKPVSYFFGEDGSSEAALAFAQGDYRRCRALLRDGSERQWLEPVALLREAEQALGAGQLPYARTLLEELGNPDSPLFGPELQRRAAILRCRCGMDAVIAEDGTLLLRAQRALNAGKAEDAWRYLSACDDRSADWDRLMGECALACGDYAAAREHFLRCQDSCDVRRQLERCCLELEDYKMAYFYAKQQ